MKALLTAALLAALALTGSAVAADTKPPEEAPKPIGPNAGPAVPKDGGKDGPYVSVFGAGVDARMRRLHCFRADVFRENDGWWYVMWYLFP
jgi:hypothetical protein